MTEKCAEDGCTNDAATRRRLCNHHRHLKQYHGTTVEPVKEVTDYSARFWSKVNKTEDCWLWTEGQQHEYGTFWDGERSVRAHRFAWEDLMQPLLPGDILDHACRNQLCVRPGVKHVRLATHKQNRENVVSPALRGVSYDKRNGKYGARVGHHGKMLWLGYFDTAEEAAAVAREKRLELHTHNELDRPQQ